MREFDFFICYASEDMDDVALPIAETLQGRGFRVWFDRPVLGSKDSLLHQIDKGLASSRFAIIILSRIFLRKEWAHHVLDALVANEENEDSLVILPIWYCPNRNQLALYSPAIVDTLALSTVNGIQAVADGIASIAGKYFLRSRCQITVSFYEPVTKSIIASTSSPICDLRCSEHDKRVSFDATRTGTDTLRFDVYGCCSIIVATAGGLIQDAANQFKMSTIHIGFTHFKD